MIVRVGIRRGRFIKFESWWGFLYFLLMISLFRGWTLVSVIDIDISCGHLTIAISILHVDELITLTDKGLWMGERREGHEAHADSVVAWLIPCGNGILLC